MKVFIFILDYLSQYSLYFIETSFDIFVGELWEQSWKADILEHTKAF